MTESDLGWELLAAVDALIAEPGARQRWADLGRAAERLRLALIDARQASR